MYLALIKTGSKTTYQIRQSFKTEKAIYRHRIIYDLGDKPDTFIEPFSDHIVLFDQDLLHAVENHTDKEGESILEHLLYQFLPTETQRRIDMFSSRTARHITPLSTEEKRALHTHIHLFDRRRLYYLRYGAVDQSRLSRLHEKCCRPLLSRSRDEREYSFATEEMVLSPGDYQQYIYAIFNIQQHFHQSFAPWFPEALARDEISDHFLTAICRLNGDDTFWCEDASGKSLNHHLVRYLIMFFDFSPAQRSFAHDFTESFMKDHRQFRWPERKPSQNPEKISELFSTPYDTLKELSREQLNRLYRKRAMKLHPDKGGDHNLFVELTEIYQQLLQSKKR